MSLSRRQFATGALLLARPRPRLAWDASTLVLVRQGGGYGRMLRLPGGGILCSYEVAGAVYVSRSRDEGRTWESEVRAASFEFGAAANPETLVLRDGSILLSLNQRPRDGVHPFAIAVCFSTGGGAAWSAPRVIYEAGTDFGTGCWEPALIRLASGEIQLFFANERPYPATTEQEITMLRSLDNGATWSQPKQVSFRAGHRDGMPVPLVLARGRGIVFAIEDNGLAGKFKPAIIHTSMEDNWNGAVTRWAALDVQLPAAVYAGAPYLRQFPGGATVLSVQSGEGRANEGSLRNSRMVVYLGDGQARHFGSPSEPFPVPPEANGLWNSLFIKNRTTVTAISGTTINGVRGLWAIDGRLRPGGRR